MLSYLIFSIITISTILKFFIKNNIFWTILKLILALLISISFPLNFNFQLKPFIFGVILFILSVIYFFNFKLCF